VGFGVVPVALVGEDFSFEVLSVSGEGAFAFKLALLALSLVEGSVCEDEDAVGILCFVVGDSAVVEVAIGECDEDGLLSVGGDVRLVGEV
jgi:hypothetical protein